MKPNVLSKQESEQILKAVQLVLGKDAPFLVVLPDIQEDRYWGCNMVANCMDKAQASMILIDQAEQFKPNSIHTNLQDETNN